MKSRTISLFQQAPFIRLLIPLCLGIILQWYLPISFPTLLKFSFAVLLGCILYPFSSLKFRYKHNYVAGISYQLIFGLTGMILVSINDIRNDKSWFGNQPTQHSIFLATIVSPLKEGSNSYKAIANVNGYYRNEQFHTSNGKIIIYFSKKSYAPIKIGKRILFDQPLAAIVNSGNPECFDYRQYCLFNGITHQVFLNQQNFTVCSDSGKTILSIINTVTERIVILLRKYIHSRKESGLAEAMLLGYKDDLDKDLLQSYTDAGVVHIIAISGMHLALIYALLIAITFPSNTVKKFIWWRVLLVLAGIWFFTLLTGFQASILRAGIMLTCFVLAKSLFRKTSSLNSLAFSAFVLLCWDPFWLWDIGFQLSYLAVTSIFIFYKPILQLFNFHNKLMRNIWKPIALTLSAQLLTTPVSIYYFHQFPRLFLLSNLIAVPLSSLILLLEIILLSVSWLPFITGFIGKLVYASIFCLDEFIIHIQKVPESIWKGLYISTIQCIIIYVLIICITTYIKYKYVLSKYLAALCIICFCSTRILFFIETNRQHKLIVFNIPGHQAVQLIDRRTNWIITGGLSRDNYLQSIQPSIIKWRLDLPTITFSKQFQFGHNRIAIIDSSRSITPQTDKSYIDILILSKNVSADINYLLRDFSTGQIVLDSSIPQWKAQLLKTQCDSLHIPCFDVRTEGAFVTNL